MRLQHIPVLLRQLIERRAQPVHPFIHYCRLLSIPRLITAPTTCSIRFAAAAGSSSHSQGVWKTIQPLSAYAFPFSISANAPLARLCRP